MNTALALSFVSAIVSLTAVGATFYGIRYTNKINVQLQDDRLRFDERRQDREMLRSKGEELVGLIDSFQTGFRNQVCDLASSILTHGSYKLGDSFSLTESNQIRQRIELLTKIYFPSAVPQLDRLVAYEEKLSLSIRELHRLSPI